MKRIAFSLALALCISLVAMGQQITEKEYTTKGGYGEKKLSKAPKRVYIASFKAYFHVIASATAKSTGGRQIGGGSYKGNTSTTMTVAVDGVDVDDFQAVTDQVYARFVDDLKAKGYEIITAEEAGKTEYYADWMLKEGGTVNYANVPGYVSVAPKGHDYYVKKETKKGREKGTFIDTTPKLSGELGDAIIIEASFAFPFIEMNTNSSNFVGVSSVKAKTDFKMASAYGQDGMTSLLEPNQIKFVSGKGPGASAEAYLLVNVDKEVPIEGVFKEEKFKERTTASSTPAYYGIVFVENKKDEVTHQASCNAEGYRAATTKLMNQLVDIGLNEFYTNAGLK